VFFTIFFVVPTGEKNEKVLLSGTVPVLSCRNFRKNAKKSAFLIFSMPLSQPFFSFFLFGGFSIGNQSIYERMTHSERKVADVLKRLGIRWSFEQPVFIWGENKRPRERTPNF